MIATATAQTTYSHALDFAVDGLVIEADECGLPLLERIQQAAMDYLHAKAQLMDEFNTPAAEFPREVVGRELVWNIMTPTERLSTGSSFGRERQAKLALRAELRAALAAADDAELVANLRDYLNGMNGDVRTAHVQASLRLLRNAR